ncbi:MAG: cell division protein FtsA [Chloroflexota bacterium]|nr:cell division protein FtsA [Chloroflexota bacterium]
MAKSRILVGIDIGTTKVSTLVVKHDEGEPLEVLGVGLAPSRGVQKGIVTDLDAATEVVASSLDKAERLSGYKISAALLGIAGGHISCLQSKGSTTLPSGGEIGPREMQAAVEAAKTVDLPSQKEILHVIPRQYSLDGSPGIKDPQGMSGFRLEVDAHIVTAHVGAVQNALKVLQRVGLEVDELVLQPLASAQAVLSSAERDLGVALVDIGGGTTDVAVFIEDGIWHTAVLPVGGNNLTNDLAIVLGIPVDSAERLKVEVATAAGVPVSVAPLPGTGNTLKVETFGEDEYKTVPRDLVHEVVDSRLSEMLTMVQTELRRSGYDDMLPAGVVLTGGSAQMRGMEEKAARVLNMPVRIGSPAGLMGLGEAVESPAFATSVGLPLWRINRPGRPARLARKAPERRSPPGKVFGWFREFLP